MKILVYAHRLELGGTQTNAVEMAAALRDLHGHDVALFATPGPASRLVEGRGLRFLPAPDAYVHPSIARMKALRDAVRRERPDLLHVWDWWQCLDAYYSVHLPMRLPMVVTDMMMSLTRVLPKALPTTFGTPEIVDHARAAGRRNVELLLPAVDTSWNAPGVVDPAPLRRQLGIEGGEVLLVTVSRLSEWLKSESLVDTVEAVRELGRELPLRFVMVGDGMARSRLQELADAVNAELGRPAVILPGALVDPRPAYAAADIVVGMGSSALRGMAFGKPVVIVGAGGFAAPLGPDTAESFLYKGIYGRGDDATRRSRPLVRHLRALASRPAELPTLGGFSRGFVTTHFALEVVTARLEAFFRSAAATPPPLGTIALDGLRSAAVYLRERGFLIPSRDRSAKRP